MFESQQVKRAVYFKQYPCYEFFISNLQHIKVKASMNCTFSFSHEKVKTNSPAAFVDKHSKQEVLYVMQWIQGKDHVLLYTKAMQEDQWIRISMNYYPDIVTISGGLIFVVGGEDLFLFDPKGEKTVWRCLQKDKIVSVHPTTCQKITQKQSQFEPGVSILYENQQNIFYSGNYSLSVKDIKKPLFHHKALNMIFKKQKILHLEVLVPNIIGLAFLEDERMCIYNLQDMKLLPRYSVRLPCKEKPMIRWKEHARNMRQKSDERFFILVGIGQFIFSYSMQINYENTVVQQLNERISLTNLLNGQMINWDSIKLDPYLTFSIEGKILVDMQISTNGFVYLSKNTATNLIGQCRYLDFKKMLNEATIMLQQSNIWRLHYQDKWSGLKINQNRLLMPNRYSYDLVTALQQKKESSQYDGIQFLNSWRINYGFRTFVIYGEELLIVRGSCLSIFRDIEEHLFTQQYLNTELLQKIEPEYLSNLRFEPFGMPGKQYKNAFNIKVCRNRQSIKQRIYAGSGQQIDNLDLILKKTVFLNTMEQITSIVSDKHEKHYSSLMIKELQEPLTCQSVRDKLSSFYLLLANGDYLFNQGQDEQAVFNELYEKYTLTVKVIQYFCDLYHRSAYFFRLFERNLIDLFIKRHNSVVSDDISFSVLRILQMLLQNLIPQNKKEFDQMNWYSNYFADFLLQKLKEAYEQNQGQNIIVLRQEISRFINLGFFSVHNKYTSYFFRNQSLIKNLFASYDSDLLEKVFFNEIMIKYQIPEVYKCYQNVKDVMQMEMVSTVQKCLFNSHNIQKFKIDRNGLDFLRQLPQQATFQVQEHYQRIKQDILRYEVDFQIDTQEIFTRISRQEHIILGKKQFDL